MGFYDYLIAGILTKLFEKYLLSSPPPSLKNYVSIPHFDLFSCRLAVKTWNFDPGGGGWMLRKSTMAIIDQLTIPINIRGGATWFDLLLSLYKVKGQ